MIRRYLFACLIVLVGLGTQPARARAQGPADYTHCVTALAALTTATPANVDSLTLAPGLWWNVTGVINRTDSVARRTLFLAGADTVTGAVTVATRFARLQSAGHANGVDSAATDTNSVTLPMWRAYFPTAPGKIYLVASATFTIGGVKVNGCLNATQVH